MYQNPLSIYACHTNHCREIELFYYVLLPAKLSKKIIATMGTFRGYVKFKQT